MSENSMISAFASGVGIDLSATPVETELQPTGEGQQQEIVPTEEPVVVSEEQPKVETPSFDESKFFEEKSGGKYKSWEELNSELSKPKQPEFKDDYSKNLYLAIQDGKDEDVYNYLSAKLFDPKKMDDMDKAKSYLQKANPSFDKEDINDELLDRFGLALSSKMTDEDDILATGYNSVKDYEKAYNANKREWKKFISEAEEDLSTNRKEYTLPKYETEAKVPEGFYSKDQWEQQLAEEDKKYQVEQEALSKLINEQFESDRKSYERSKKVTINVGDSNVREDFDVKYEMSDKDNEELFTMVQKLADGSFFEQFKTADNRYDFKAVADALTVNNPLLVKMLKSGLKERGATAKQEVIQKQLKNVDFSPNQAGAVANEPNVFQQMMMRR